MGKTLQEVEALIPNLVNIKSQIRQAIIDKGVEIPQDSSLEDYAGYIGQIVVSHDDIELEWLANADDTYFDLGFKPNINTKLEYRGYLPTANRYLYGCYKNRSNRVVFTSDSTNYVSLLGPTSSSISQSGVSFPVTMSAYMNNGKNTFVLNGTTVTNTSNFVDADQVNLYFYAHNNDGTVSNICSAGIKMYYLKHYQSNVLTHHWVPVRHWVNGAYVTCLKDKVGGEYYYSKGTEELTYG